MWAAYPHDNSVTSQLIADLTAGGATVRVDAQPAKATVRLLLTVLLPLMIATTILTESALSFLSIGVQPPNADWGVMVSEGRGYINLAPVGTLAPAAAIAFLSVALNLIADALTQHVTQGRREIVPL